MINLFNNLIFRARPCQLSGSCSKGQFEIFKIAKKYGDMRKEEQIVNLLELMGPESIHI